MKKMIAGLLGVIITAITAASHVNAQGKDKNIAFLPAKNRAAFVAFFNHYNTAETGAAITLDKRLIENESTLKASKAAFKTAKSNNRALRYFSAVYKKDMPDAKWFMLKNGMIASFYRENVKTDIAYNKNGRWIHTLTYYPEGKTPEDIAAVIREAYPKDKIMLAVQIEEGARKFYIVQLENKTTLKKVTVYEGEVNLIQELTKSN